MKNEADVKLTVDTHVSPKNPAEYIRSLCLMDDIFMAKCFEDNIECTELAERTSYFKNEKKGEAVMSGVIEELLRETKKETEERVQREMSEKVARKLLMAENISYEKISGYSSLPLNEVKHIAEEIKKADIS